MEDYYDQFLQQCTLIPQQPDKIYLREAFREGLRTKMKMAIISMPRKTLTEVAKFAILVEKKLFMRRNSMARYPPNNIDSDDLKIVMKMNITEETLKINLRK